MYEIRIANLKRQIAEKGRGPNQGSHPGSGDTTAIQHKKRDNLERGEETNKPHVLHSYRPCPPPHRLPPSVPFTLVSPTKTPTNNKTPKEREGSRPVGRPTGQPHTKEGT